MATAARTPKADPTPANDTNGDNLRLWNKLGKTDPRHTKAFTRGGGFKGTAMKPMWQNMKLTETFGPCGVGWGFDKPEFQTIDGAKDEMLVYCTVSAWYVPDPTKPDDVAHVYGVGGDKVISKFQSGPSNDDEAFKKAFTDAIGNAFKFIGVGADVHMGLFDDSKYVQDLRAEFEAADDTLGPKIDALLEDIINCPDLATLMTEILPRCQSLSDELEKAQEGYKTGPIVEKFNAKKKALAPPKVDPPTKVNAVPEQPAEA